MGQDLPRKWGLQHRRAALHPPRSSGRAEVSAKAIRRTLHDNIPEDGPKRSPMLPEDTTVTNNPMVSTAWKDLSSKKEAVMQDRYLKNLEAHPTPRPPTRKEHTKALIR